MKEEYKDLLDLDTSKIEPMPLSDQKKVNIKKHVLSHNKVRKRVNGRYLAVAAIFSLSVITASIMTVPAIATQVPFIQSILSHFEDEALPDKYDDLATVVNQVQSSNGIEMMIENAVYDGTSLIVTYAIQTEADLGSNPMSEGHFDIKDASGSGATARIEKINDHTYIGIETVTPHFDGKSPEEILVQWEPRIFTNYQTNEQFEGDWKFEFSLSPLKTNLQPLNETVSDDGITFVLKSIEHSEMTAVLQYEYYVDPSILKDSPFVTIDISEVKDNLGNVYKVNGNGGVSRDNSIHNESSTTIYSLEPNAETLTIIPKVYYSKGSGLMTEVKNMKPVTVDLK